MGQEGLAKPTLTSKCETVHCHFPFIYSDPWKPLVQPSRLNFKPCVGHGATCLTSSWGLTSERLEILSSHLPFNIVGYLILKRMWISQTFLCIDIDQNKYFGPYNVTTRNFELSAACRLSFKYEKFHEPQWSDTFWIWGHSFGVLMQMNRCKTSGHSMHWFVKITLFKSSNHLK